MKKKNVQAVITILFTAVLMIFCLTERSKAQPEEMIKIQDAMRNLKRVDNLEYSYAYKTTLGGESQMQSVDVWADQLEGSWVAEYYSTDEDGTLCILKQFCDGRDVYHYVEWSGEWVKQSGVSKEVPNFETVTSLNYDSTAIVGIDNASESGYQRITCQLAPETYSTDYPKVITSVLQIQDIQVAYSIDTAGVLCGEYSMLVLSQQEATEDQSPNADVQAEDSQNTDEQTEDVLTVEVQVTVKRYNQEGILNKIEQCRNELW